MINILNKLIAYLTRLRDEISEREEREEFIRKHYKDIENPGKFWDSYH